MDKHYLTSLFAPESIVVFAGPVDTPGAPQAQALVAALKAEPFSGTLNFLDIHTSGTLADLAQTRADLAIIVLPPEDVAAALEVAGRIKCRSALVVSSGTNAALASDLHQVAKRHGMHLLGPNCLGFQNPRRGLNASVAGALAIPGHLALVSQSGALTASILDWAQHNAVGFSTVVSLGPNTAVDLAQVLDFHLGMASMLRRRGGDPAPDLDLARRAIRRATEKAPGMAWYWELRGDLEGFSAETALQQGRDPGPFLIEMENSFGRMLHLDPRDALAAEKFAAAGAMAVRRSLLFGGKPDAFLDRSLGKVDGLAKILPDGLSLRLVQARLTRLKGEIIMGREGEADPYFRSAREILAACRKKAPPLPGIEAEDFALCLAQAEHALHAGKSPMTWIRRARQLDSRARPPGRWRLRYLEALAGLSASPPFPKPASPDAEALFWEWRTRLARNDTNGSAGVRKRLVALNPALQETLAALSERPVISWPVR